MTRIGLVLGLLVATTASAFAGNELGNGGDGYAQEFVAVGRAVLAKLRVEPDARVASVDELEKVINETLVVTKDKVDLNGNEVDAVNYPQSHRIELNRSRWKQYSANEKSSLALHEYLGIANVEDSHYQVSGAYSEAYGQLVEPAKEAPKRFFVGFGESMPSFRGNLGKLYSSFSPGLQARMGYLLDSHFVVVINGSRSRFGYIASSTGDVDATLLELNLLTQFHFLENKQWSTGRGFDPYISTEIGQTFRTQDFNALNVTQKDNAQSVYAGLGTNFGFGRGKPALWVDAKIGKIYFKDRFAQTYWEDGLSDSDGYLVALGAGLQIFF